MSVRYILGRSGSGKTHYIFNDIKDKLREKEDIARILIVPEQFTFQTQKDLINFLNQKGIMAVEILSFQRLAFRIFEELGPPREKFLGELGRNMVLSKVIDDISEELKIYHKSVKQPGFMQNLGDMICEFQQYDVSPTDLLEKKEFIKDRPILEAKINDLFLIYQNFNNYIKEKYITSQETLDLLAQKIGDSNFLENAYIWIDGFYGFTPQQYRILTGLFKKAKEVSISLTLDPRGDLYQPFDETDPFYESRRTMDKLNKLTAFYNIALEEPVKLYNEKEPGINNKELYHLEKEYFNYPVQVYENKTEYIKLFVASNPYSELEHTARLILEFVRDKGYRYREIAVVTGKISQYQKLIEAIFKEYNIPFFIDEKKDILSHPLIELIRAALEILNSNWSYESVFRYLKTGFTGIAMEDVDLLENYVLAYGIKGISKWTKEDWKIIKEDFEDELQKKYEESLLERINQIRNIFIEPLIKLSQKLKNKKNHTFASITKALYEFLEDLGVRERLAEYISHFKEDNKLSLVNENLQIWDFVVELFDKMVEILGEEPVSLKQYPRVLDAGFEQCKMGLIPPALDQIVVADLERSRLPRIKALFVIGINDGIIPANKEELRLFSDEERRTMEELGVELAPDSRRKAFEEQFLIYSGLTKPEEYLHLSFSLGDVEGKALRPSVLISRIKKIFPKLSQESDLIMSEESDFISSPGATFSYLGQALRELLDADDFSDVWKDVLSWYVSQEDWKDKVNITIRGLFHNNQEYYLKKETVRKLYKDKIYTSVSRLEKFAACPFGYFVQYGLKAKERKIYQLSLPDLGILFHSALDIFSKKLLNSGLSWRDLNDGLRDQMVEETINEIAPKLGNEILLSTEKNKYLIRRIKRITKRAVWALTEHVKRGNFKPAEFEIGFGENHPLPPIVIELSNGEKLILTGRIDRVDILDEEDKIFVKIIDYKSGSQSFNLADIFYGIQMQLILYLDAFLESGQILYGKKIFPAGAFYFRIDDPIISSAGEMTEEELQKLLLKELKLSGIVLEDEEIIRKMDNTIEKSSDIIPVEMTKSGIGKKSNTATMEQFDSLREYVRKMAVEIGEEIIKGNVKISPYKSDKGSSCQYCLYKSICQFDTLLEDNHYKYLHKLSKDEIWKKIEESIEKE